MDRARIFAFIVACGIAAAIGIYVPANSQVEAVSTVEQTETYIVQGGSTAAMAAAIRAVGGEVTDELTIIGAVGASLSSGQIEALRCSHTDLKFFRDG